MPSSARLLSLDAFRGATIASMVLVNVVGGFPEAYSQLRHARWDGWTFTDLVFPFFLWMVGVAMTYSTNRRLEKGDNPSMLLGHALRRTVILFALGVFLYLYPDFDFSTARILGVLQRIAICYFISFVILLHCGIRAQCAWLLFFLGSYWALMTLVPVPGFGAGRFDVEGNFAHWIDSMVLGRHNYVHTKTWDPEGLVSTLPAIATTLFGALTGHWLHQGDRAAPVKAAWMFTAGNLLIVAGLALSPFLPINKSLWTSTYAIFMAGMALSAFSVFYWLLDANGNATTARWAAPLVTFGANAIAIYMAHELFDVTAGMPLRAGRSLHDLAYQDWLAPWLGGANASLLYGLANVLLMYAIARFLERRKWFIRL